MHYSSVKRLYQLPNSWPSLPRLNDKWPNLVTGHPSPWFVGFLGDKLGEKLATVWDWLWPGSPGELWLASVWSHCSTAGHWLGLCNPLKCSVKWGYILVVSTGSELRRCIRNRRGLWKNIWKLMRSVELRILNGLEGEDPPEVAQETPIFGRTHHLTNTRVKISMMHTMRMRRTHKK